MKSPDGKQTRRFCAGWQMSSATAARTKRVVIAKTVSAWNTAASLPADYKLRSGQSKYLLKKIFKNILPAEVLKRKKMDFGVPLTAWFRSELKDYRASVILSEKTLKRGYFNSGYLKKLFNEHAGGRVDHANQLYLLLILEIWHQTFIDVNPRMDTLILAYHRVNDWSEDTLTVHPAVFRKQLNYLAGKYRFVSLSELVTARTKRLKPKEWLAAITFDDGYSDNFRCACPILKEFGFTATFFLTAGYIGTDKLLPRDEKRGNIEKDRLLNWPEVSEMKKAGFTFGSHSLTHANLVSIDPEQARKEITESKKVLETHLPEPTNLFCYPFGFYSPEVKRMVADAGYQAAFVTPPVRGAGLLPKHRIAQDRYSLKRVGVYHHTAFWQFWLKTKM